MIDHTWAYSSIKPALLAVTMSGALLTGYFLVKWLLD